MMRESVIITPFLIERAKQVKLFQIKIPREAKNIIGIEMGVKFQEGAPVPPAPPVDWVLPMLQKRNRCVGELKLQSYEKANIFYTGELTMNYNMDQADFTSKWFVPKVYTHQAESHESDVSVSGTTTIIQGVFRDKLSESQEAAYKYTVYVYLWLESKDNENTKQP
jgi:hypothetical protein